MNSTVEMREKRVAEGGGVANLNWSLWARQTLAVLRLELGRNFLGRRALLLYVLAGLPLAVLAAVAVFLPGDSGSARFAELSIAYSVIYGVLILRTLLFFGCAWVFMNLFRGEVVDRSLHYYFLAPVRREVLVVGKYLSGLVATVTLFGTSTLGSLALLYFGLFRHGAWTIFSTAPVSGRHSRILASRRSRASVTGQFF